MKLLIEDYPLIVLPGLAQNIGLNEAIMLQQIHFWLNKNKNVKEGISWVYNTYAGWAEQFPFWSESTIKRTIRSLEKQNLLIVDNFNKLKIDNTKWYSINYDELNRVTRPSGQIDLTNGSKRPDGTGQNDPAITIDYPETTTETIPYVEIINYLNDAANKNFKNTTSSTRRNIKARWNEGFRLEDFKKVIDIKTTEWKHDPNMNRFLRPDTLFGTKFEGYLNQKPAKPKGEVSLDEFNLDD